VPAATAEIRGKLSSSGSVSPQLLRRLEGVRQHGLAYGGPVPKRQVSRFYGSLDSLILLLPSGPYITGGKTAEYLATGLPIVSVHDLTNPTTDMLREYPLWFPARELTAASVSAALRDCAQALREPNVERWNAAWDYGQLFLRTALMAPVIEELTYFVTGPQHELQSRSADAPSASGPTAEPLPKRQPDPTARENSGSRSADVRQVKVLVIMNEGSTEVLEDLRARTSSIGGIAVSLVAFVADGDQPINEAHVLPAPHIGPAERLTQRLAAVHGPAGVMGRLLRDNLHSRRLVRSVLNDRLFMAELLAADVVMAADSVATRAVWQLKSRTQADLVRGAVALVHVLRNR
jgi:hypothetical protein